MKGDQKKEEKRLTKIWPQHRLAFGLLGTGILLLILGLTAGEYWTVLEKAVTICLDCLGIG
ncbi:MAG: CD1871A family CXXC motif-containing protein [Candidatus Aminicenantes bacterium]|nr:CD1871A family CXXC motif-containing protein [Candidatus Aminicenantes bacterium]